MKIFTAKDKDAVRIITNIGEEIKIDLDTRKVYAELPMGENVMILEEKFDVELIEILLGKLMVKDKSFTIFR